MSWPGRGGVVWTALVTVAAAVLAGVMFWAVPHRLTDLSVYVGGTEAFLRGGGLYDYELAGRGLRFTYPTFAAILFTPLTLMPHWLAAALLTLVDIVVAIVLIRVIRKRVDLVFVVFLGFLLLSEPGRENLWLGQINFLITALVVIDLLLIRNRRLSGIALGIAIGVKLTPAIFVAYLLLIGRYRSAANAVGAFAATVLIALIAAPKATVTYFSGLMLDADRVGGVAYVSNQSLRGVAERLLGTGSAGVVAVIAGVIALGVCGCAAWSAHRSGHELMAVFCVGVAGLLFSPISWSHHWLWLTLLVIAVIERPIAPWVSRIAWGAAVILGLGPIWWFANPNGAPVEPGLVAALVTSAYAIAAFALVVAIISCLGPDVRRSSRRPCASGRVWPAGPPRDSGSTGGWTGSTSSSP